MSSSPPQMPAPVCLIENTDEGLQTVESSLDLLRRIQQPVVVVAVVGLYRTGKSYLMNRLAGQQSGFALGSTIESKTKGIWMLCMPHPSNPGHTLVLLDTEGLGDVDKGNSKNDALIFCLALILSSTLVYNSRSTIDNEAIEKLRYVTELTELIQVKYVAASNDNIDENQFVRFFPDFIWAIRDFILERKIDGQDVSEDKYLEFALQLKQGWTKKATEYNQVRGCIKSFFPTRKCFTFPFPTSAENMKHLDSMDESKLCPDFLKVMDRFRSYVFKKSRPKTIPGGEKVTGSRLSHLVEVYVGTIKSGSVLCVESAALELAEIENQSAVQEGFQLYEQGMENLKKTFPIDLGSLSAEHKRLLHMATEKFLNRSFKDQKGIYITNLREKVGKLYEQLIAENMQASEDVCQKLLFDLYKPMAAKIEQGTYAMAGGYNMYCRERENMLDEYRSHKKRGAKGEEVLEKFLQDKNAEANAILKADEKLTEAEKNMAVAKEEMHVLEQKTKVEEQQKEELQRALAEEKQSQMDLVKQMKEKNEEENRLQHEELDRAMESKLTEHKEMLEKGFKDMAELLSKEIEQLKKQRQEHDPGFFKTFLLPVAKIGAHILSKAIGLDMCSQIDYHDSYDQYFDEY